MILLVMNNWKIYLASMDLSNIAISKKMKMENLDNLPTLFIWIKNVQTNVLKNSKNTILMEDWSVFKRLHLKKLQKRDYQLIVINIKVVYLKKNILQLERFVNSLEEMIGHVEMIIPVDQDLEIQIDSEDLIEEMIEQMIDRE